MPAYRAFPINESGQVFRAAIELECNSDQDAIAAAKALDVACDLDVWQGARHVCKVKRTRDVAA